MPDVSTLKNLAVSETGFAFDPRSGATYSLNPTALVLVAALREGGSVDTLVERLDQEFQGAAHTREDVVDFVQALCRHGLLPPNFQL